MKKCDISNRKNRKTFFGPGTILALIVAVCLFGSGTLFRKDPPPLQSGKIVYEADAQGRMRQVDVPSASALPAVPPLWKPEPDLLMRHADALHLNRSQRLNAKAMVSAWQREKAQWEVEMQRALGQADAHLQRPASGAVISLVELRQGMSDYSAISREYDARRADAWAQANALLTAAQRQQLDRLTHPSQRAR